ncbi:MAG TPA: peptidyl-prolyl cis-trans isomerase [Candidatus Omnitrophota bacterium]|nr:peptidyl-prolyl cis-trans isomerase [Candidatus Omnitrophota bacterium]
MLNILRKKGVAKKILWVIAVVIIFSFGFFGTGYLLTGRGRMDYAGKIFGQKISIDDFNRVYQNTRIQAIRQYGYDLDRFANLLNLETQTWTRLILLHETKKRRINAPDRQVIDAIARDKSFERDGRFDALLYNAILRNLRIRPRDYEESVRDNLKITELYKQVTSSVTITEEEVFEEYKNRNEKVQVSYVLVSPAPFKESIRADETEAKQYYEDNKSDFLLPPTINVQYLTFPFPEESEPESSEPPSPENADEINKSADIEKEKDLIREKADAVFEALIANPNMADAAQQNNLTVQTTGFFSMEQPNLTLGWSYDFLNELFAMNVNDISAPFETPNGLSIVQIKEKRYSYVPEFSEARPKAEEAVINKKAKEIAAQKAEEYLQQIQSELDKTKLKDFAKTAKDLGLEIGQTPVFNRGQYLPQIGISKEFQEAAFALTENNKISSVVETPAGYCILYLDNYVPIENGDYEQTKEELAQALSDEKRNAAFESFVAQLRIEAKIFDNLPKPQN